MQHAPVPDLEFHGGKRPHEMTTDELLAAIRFSNAFGGDARERRWQKKLADEFDRRCAELARTR